MATIYIDRVPYEVKDGQNLLDACLSLGFDVPYFCWHPALHAVGACRLCAVKVFRDEKDTRGRIVMSCMMPAADGTLLSIDDPEARRFRAAVIEWLMTNHPHDCPVCDEGGECHLQDMTVMTGHVYRRYRYRKRTHRNQDLGPLVNHEMNRCIACYRCVRFYRDYAGGRDFGVFASHNNVYFGRHAEGVLESEFSGNLVEVCPTGVFTDKTLKRHFARKWDLRTAPSICGHCSLGCNTIPGERDGTLRRIWNRFNGAVNGYFLCDRGRYGYEFVNSGDRIGTPILRSGNAGKDAAGAGMPEAVAALLSHAKGVVGIGSPVASLEANFLLRSLVGPERFHHGLGDRDFRLASLMAEALQKGFARPPSLADMAAADAVFVLGEDLTNTAPMAALALRQAVRQAPGELLGKLHIPLWDDTAAREAVQDLRGPLYMASLRSTKLDDIAAATLRAAPDDLARLGFAVAHALNPDDPDCPAVPGLSAEMGNLAAEIAGSLKAAERPLIVSGMSCGSEAVIHAAARVARALGAMGRPAGLSWIFPAANSLGLALLGGRPAGEAVKALRSGEADTVILLEIDPDRFLEQDPAEILRGAKQVIVIDYLPSRWTSRADAVLPAATFPETTGTFVNQEGRAQRFYRVYPPGDSIRESWRWLIDILRAAGREDARALDDFDDVVAALAAALPLFRLITDLAPPSGFRVAGLRVPRESHRCSGRTALHAGTSVHEPMPPEDRDSPFSFSMEGYEGPPPSPLVPRFWAPGWNSVQSVGKFQKEPGGSLRGGDPGKRLFEAAPAGKPDADRTAPPAFVPREGALLAVPLHHLFGSERLSAMAPGIAALVPEPYLALNAEDAGKAGIDGKGLVELSLPGRVVRLAVRIDPSLPQGVAGLPLGLKGLEAIELPAWGEVKPDGEEKNR